MGGKPVTLEGVTTISKTSITDNDILTRNKPLIVSFSAPMVDASKVDQAVDPAAMPFSITPAVAGEGVWITPDSFAFTATQGYPKGSQFFVLFREDLTDLNGKPVRYFFSFRTMEIAVSRIYPGVVDADNSLAVEFVFNQPVPASFLREHLAITDEATDEVITFSIKGDSEKTSHTAVAFLKQYRPRITLSIAEDANKTIGMPKPFATTLTLEEPGKGGAAAVVQNAQSGNSPLSISYTSSEGGSARSEPTVSIYLSESLAEQDASKYIRVTPDLPYTLDSARRSLRFTEKITPGMTLSVALLPGLMDDSGRILDKEVSKTIKIGNKSPSIAFSNPGNHLAPTLGSRVGVDLVNLDHVTVTLRRQYDNNLPFLNYDQTDTNLARKISVVTVPVKSKKNETIHRSIDLDSLAKGQKGAFFLEIAGFVENSSSNGESSMDWYDRETTLVVLSDIGVTTRAFPSGITIFASQLSTGKPLPNAKVCVYSSSNQLIAQGKTGPDGLFIHARDSKWDSQLLPHVVTVATDNDLTFLPVTSDSQIELPDTGERPYLDKGYEAFAYTPRGVFRPGETVNIKTFVRDSKHMPPSPFPVVCTLTSSRGLEAGRATTTLSAQGGGDFAFTLPLSAATGEYTATIRIPGHEAEELGTVRFSVEDFVPPRLEVTVAPQEEMLIGKADLPITLTGQYLFGAPGADLGYELGFKLFPKSFSAEGYEEYSFGDIERKFEAQGSLKHLTGTLNETGTTTITFSAPDDWQPSSMMQVLFVGSVQEDGGRWVTQTHMVDYFPTPYLLGFQPDRKGKLTAGKPVQMSLAALTPKGKTTDCGTVTVEVFRLQGNWNTVLRDGRYTHIWNERRIPVQELTVPTKNGTGSFTFTPPQLGNYLVRGKAEQDNVTAAMRVGVWNGEPNSDEGAGRMDQVEVRLDKLEYQVGETAKVSIKAPYAGTLLLGLERGQQLWARTITMETPATVVDIPVTANMDPNVTITAWVFRPMSMENKEWYSHRAHGNASLLLSKKPHTLTVKAVTPEQAKPSAPVTIPFAVTNADGQPVQGEFSVALIDEGVLSLTSFRTPDPLAFFMTQRSSVGESFDMYDRLLRPAAKAIPLLIPGGDGSRDYLGSLSTQQIYLTAYLPTVLTDAEGRGEAVFDIPEYSGKGRLMIVGVAGKTFASASDNIRVARDVVTEVTAPRTVAPGDIFDITVKTFCLKPELATSATITISSKGPLTLAGKTTYTLPLDKTGKSTIVKATAQEAHAVATIIVAVSVPGRDDLSFSKEIEVVVRPPYPRNSSIKSALIKGGTESTLTIPGKWLNGSVKASLSVDTSPVFAILPALDYLREYPYGCLEQTTSRAWPYLVLPTIENALSPAPDEKSQGYAPLNDIVTRIISMQTLEGGFSMWPGNKEPDPWKSVLATFFLVEAKRKVPVPQASLARALNYMTFLLAAPEGYYSSRQAELSTKAFAAFALTRAEKAPLSWLQHLTEQEKDMLPSGKILLAAAKSLQAGNPKALMALSSKDMALDSKKLGYNDTLESDLRNLALSLLAWSYVAPTSPETLALVKTTAEKVTSQKYFTTQEAGFLSLAFGTYLDKSAVQGAKYTAVISAAGKAIATATSENRLLLGTQALPITNGNPAPITVAVQGSGQAYAVYSVRGVPLTSPKPAQSNMTLKRVWKSSDGTVLNLDEPVRIKKGERILIEITAQAKYSTPSVAITDMLPGGLEIENPRLKTPAAEGEGDDSSSQSGASREQNVSDDENDEHDDGGETLLHKEPQGINLDVREDRLLLFLSGLDGNTQNYTYSVRAVTRGTFILPPLAAEGMYNPDVSAITASGMLIVE